MILLINRLKEMKLKRKIYQCINVSIYSDLDCMDNNNNLIRYTLN